MSSLKLSATIFSTYIPLRLLIVNMLIFLRISSIERVAITVILHQDSIKKNLARSSKYSTVKSLVSLKLKLNAKINH